MQSSVLGGFSLYGPRGVDFWTQNAVRLRPITTETKAIADSKDPVPSQTITAHWRADDAAHSKADVAMPVHH